MESDGKGEFRQVLDFCREGYRTLSEQGGAAGKLDEIKAYRGGEKIKVTLINHKI